MDPQLGAVIISIAKDGNNWRVISWLEKAVQRYTVPAKDLKAEKSAVCNFGTALSHLLLYLCTDTVFTDLSFVK